MTKSILALTKYGSLAASTRQRLQIYEPALDAAGFHIDYAPLLGDDHVRRLVQGERTGPIALARAYLDRLGALFRARRYDLVWVHYEVFPYLPLEWLAGWIGRPLVVDYDDATFHRYDQGGAAGLLRGKLEPLLRAADACVCGNEYLRAYAADFCPNMVVIPTVVDTERYVPATAIPAVPTIGWIGSPSTWANVRPLLPVIEEVCKRHRARFRVVGAGSAAADDRFEAMDLVDWSEAGEVADVQAMTIGIMPLADAPFERGKCGYKLVQYMACGLPVIASPVGVNADIVDDGMSGFLAISEDEWTERLSRLLSDPVLRAAMGAKSRARAVADYSLASQAPRMVDVFRSVAGT